MTIPVWLNIVIVGVASFACGCLVPIAYNSIIHVAKRTGTPHLIVVLFGLLLCFGLASAFLVYLSTTRGGQPIVIVFSFIAGFGVGRLLQGGYRRK